MNSNFRNKFATSDSQVGRKGASYSRAEILEMENIASVIINDNLGFSVESVAVAMQKLNNKHIFGNRSTQNVFTKMSLMSKC